jgi:hypothetical protein
MLMIVCLYKIKAQVTLVGAKMTGASGAIVQETGIMVLEFSDSGITYANGDKITMILPTGTSINTASPVCAEQLGEFIISS